MSSDRGQDSGPAPQQAVIFRVRESPDSYIIADGGGGSSGAPAFFMGT